MDEIQEQIISILSSEKKPLMIKTIAEKCRLNPQTVARRLDTLELFGRVRKIQIGNAKKYYLIDTLKVSGLIDISSDLILILNSSHVIQYLNHAARKYLGLESRKVVGERLEFLNLDIFTSPKVLEGLRRFNTEKVFRTEITFTHDGKLRWYFVSILTMALNPNTLSIAIIIGDTTEKRQLEEKIRESEAKYRMISENSSDIIWLLDIHSQKFLYVSPSVYQLLGYQSEELADIAVDTVLRTPFSRGFFQSLLSRAGALAADEKSDRIHQEEIDLMHQNGSLIPTETVTTLLTDTNGKVTRILGVTRNISARRQNEIILRKSQEHITILADILERSFQPILVSYPDQRVEYCNAAFERLIGFTREELRGIHVTNPAEWVQWIEQDRENLELLHKTGEAVRYEQEYIRKDGKGILVEVAFHLIRNDQGEVIRYYRFVTDITERNEIEERLQDYQVHLEQQVEERTKSLRDEIDARILSERRLLESEKRFHQVAENAEVWIWEIDCQGIYRYCSPFAYRIIGYTPEELIGRCYSDFYSDDSRNELVAIINSVARRKESFRSFPIEMVHRNGSVIRVESSSSPVYNPEGRITGYRGAYADITEQTRMEKTLLESRNYNRLLFEDSPVPQVLVDAETMTYLDCNKAALKLYQSSFARLIGKKIGILSKRPGSGWEEVSTHFERCIADGEDSFEAWFQRLDGGTWNGRVSLVRFEHGEKSRILICFQEYLTGRAGRLPDPPAGYSQGE